MSGEKQEQRGGGSALPHRKNVTEYGLRDSPAVTLEKGMESDGEAGEREH